MNPNQTPYSPQKATAGPKQLRRSRTDRKISGVCGGIAEYLDVDANLVRLLVVVGTILTGGGLALAYLVALVIMPEAPAAPVWNGYAAPAAGQPQRPAASTQAGPASPAGTGTPPAATPMPSGPGAEPTDGSDKPSA